MSANWWEAVWLEKMERLAEPSRFREGLGIAEGNKVQRLRLEGRTIAAMAEGYGEPLRTVRITFDAFSREQWEQLVANLRDGNATASALEAGDLPLEMQTAFSKAKLRFMPERNLDLHLECVCPDWLKPCRHMVAVWLKFGRDFARDPLLLFQLRGLNRQEVFQLLRGRVETAPEPEVEEDEPEYEPVPVRLEPLPADPEAYWAERPIPVLGPEAGERRATDENLLERLGAPPFAKNWNTVQPQLHRIYDAVFEFATLLLKKA